MLKYILIPLTVTLVASAFMYRMRFRLAPRLRY